VLYYSRTGTVAELARHAARGVEAAGAEALVRTVPSLSSGNAAAASGPPHVRSEELRNCDGLLLGSPTRFGNMAAPLKYCLEQTSDIWLSGALVDKPAGVFTASSSAHGGQESTLLTMILPLVHHGMIWVGLPYTVNALFTTRDGGGPYGASHVDRSSESAAADLPQLSATERQIAEALGARVARVAVRLRSDDA
jgi:NAD(P)H dehydrogenase (quinone)